MFFLLFGELEHLKRHHQATTYIRGVNFSVPAIISIMGLENSKMEVSKSEIRTQNFVRKERTNEPFLFRDAVEILIGLDRFRCLARKFEFSPYNMRVFLLRSFSTIKIFTQRYDADFEFENVRVVPDIMLDVF